MIKKQNLLFIKCLSILWLILFFSINSASQNRTLFKKTLSLPINNNIKVQKADSLIKIFEEKKSDSLAFIYNDYAFNLFNNADIEKVIFHAEKALLLIQKTLPNNIDLIQLYSTDLAYYYLKNNQIIKAIDVYKRIITYNNSSSYASSSYLQLADIYYYNLNDYYKAKEYYEVVISIFSKSTTNKNLISLRNAYNNLMYTCFHISTTESLKKGFYYGKIADSLSKKTDISLKDSFLIKLGLASSNTEEENLNFNIAYKYYIQALEIAKKTSNSSYSLITYGQLGNLYSNYNKEKSIEYYKKAIHLTKNKDTLGSLFYGISQAHSIEKDYITSLTYKHDGLNYATGNNFINLKTINNKFLVNVKKKPPLLINLQQLAQTYLNYYEVKEDISFLEKAIAYFKMCDVLVDALKTDSKSFKSRLYWRKLSTDIYGKAIKACYLSNNIEDAFYFMEKNKALLLLEDISNKKFKRALQLSHDVLEKSKVLERKIALANDYLYNESTLTKIKTDSLKKQRIDLEIELSLLEGDTKLEALEIETSILSLQDVQNNLIDNEVVLEYHISIDDGYGILTNKDNGYALFITKNDTQLFEINQLGELKKEIITLINSLKSPFKTQQEIDDFNEQSNTVYNKLFPSKEIQDLIKDKTVTIIPDSYLSLLPFEALSTSSDSISYLIRDTEIHYLYSNSFLENTKKEFSSDNKSLAIAPINFKDKNLLSLKNSEQEINSIQDYYPGTILLNTEATKTNFLTALPTSKIVHIASHANAQNKKAPWIAFNDEKITLEELYLTENNASLVVLSGCNTTLGEQEVGEGVMSLARGFFYSGSQSVVSSLWSIDDRSTSKIVNFFYKNLSEGQTKSKALHNAKLTYLDNHSFSESSPYFWTSLILLGENDTLKPTSSNWILYLSIFIGVCIVLYFIKKNKS